MWHACVSRTHAVEHLTLRLLLDIVALYATFMSFVLTLGITEVEANAKGESFERNIDGLMIDKVSATALALNFQIAFVGKSESPIKPERLKVSLSLSMDLEIFAVSRL